MKDKWVNREKGKTLRTNNLLGQVDQFLVDFEERGGVKPKSLVFSMEVVRTRREVGRTALRNLQDGNRVVSY